MIVIMCNNVYNNVCDNVCNNVYQAVNKTKLVLKAIIFYEHPCETIRHGTLVQKFKYVSAFTLHKK